MDMDDLEPRKKPQQWRDLEDMSIDALHDYIADLEAEIARVKADIKAKEAAKAGAEAFFRK